MKPNYKLSKYFHNFRFNHIKEELLWYANFEFLLAIVGITTTTLFCFRRRNPFQVIRNWHLHRRRIQLIITCYYLKYCSNIPRTSSQWANMINGWSQWHHTMLAYSAISGLEAKNAAERGWHTYRAASVCP